MKPQLTPRLSLKAVRFPNRIREYRLKACLTQAELATLLGKNRKVVSAWERGLRFPSGPTGLLLGKALSTLLEGLYDQLYTAYRPEEHRKPDRHDRAK